MLKDSSNDSYKESSGVVRDTDHILLRAYSVVATSFTGLLLYLVPPTIAVMLLWLLLQLFGNSSSYSEQLLQSSAIVQFMYIAITEVIVIAVLVMLLKLGNLSWQKIGLARPKLNVIYYIVVGIFAYYAIFIVIALISQAVLPIDFNQKQEIGFDTTITGISLLCAFMSLVILPPLVEEILFRGYLYTKFKQVASVIWSTVFVSVLFGAAHLQIGSGNSLLWFAAIDTMILSFVLVYLREKSGNIWAGVGVHALKNLVAFTILFNPLQLPLM